MKSEVIIRQLQAEAICHSERSEESLPLNTQRDFINRTICHSEQSEESPLFVFIKRVHPLSQHSAAKRLKALYLTALVQDSAAKRLEALYLTALVQDSVAKRLEAFYHTARGSAPGKPHLTTAAPCKGKSNRKQIMPLQGARWDANLYPGRCPGLSRYKAFSLKSPFNEVIQ